jgi:hypothetical protein
LPHLKTEVSLRVRLALFFAGYFLGPTLTGIVSDMYGGVQYGMILCLGWSIFGFVFMLLAWFAAQWV